MTRGGGVSGGLPALRVPRINCVANSAAALLRLWDGSIGTVSALLLFSESGLKGLTRCDVGVESGLTRDKEGLPKFTPPQRETGDTMGLGDEAELRKRRTGDGGFGELRGSDANGSDGVVACGRKGRVLATDSGVDWGRVAPRAFRKKTS